MDSHNNGSVLTDVKRLSSDSPNSTTLQPSKKVCEDRSQPLVKICEEEQKQLKKVRDEQVHSQANPSPHGEKTATGDEGYITVFVVDPLNLAKITKQQLEQVHTALSNALIQRLQKGGNVPSFGGITHMSRCLRIRCSDQDSLQWLKTTVTTLKPWEGAQLAVLNEDEFPRFKLIMLIPSKCMVPSDIDIRNVLILQNPQLSIKYWSMRISVIRREEEAHLVTCWVGKKDAEWLKANNCMLNFMFTRTYTRFLQPRDDVEQILSRKLKTELNGCIIELQLEKSVEAVRVPSSCADST